MEEPDHQHVLEANPNIAADAEVAFAAEAAGLDHAALIQRLLDLAPPTPPTLTAIVLPAPCFGA